MYDKKDSPIPSALYHAAIGKMILDYVGQIDPMVMEKAMENQAIQTLEAIRCILEDDRYTDLECFEIIDTLVMQFFKELEIRIDRHSEYD